MLVHTVRPKCMQKHTRGLARPTINATASQHPTTHRTPMAFARENEIPVPRVPRHTIKNNLPNKLQRPAPHADLPPPPQMEMALTAPTYVAPHQTAQNRPPHRLRTVGTPKNEPRPWIRSCQRNNEQHTIPEPRPPRKHIERTCAPTTNSQTHTSSMFQTCHNPKNRRAHSHPKRRSAPGQRRRFTATPWEQTRRRQLQFKENPGLHNC